MVYHVLSTGEKLSTIQGHVVKLSDAAALYRLLDIINQERGDCDIDCKNQIS